MRDREMWNERKMGEGVGLEHERDKEWRKRMKEKIKSAKSRKREKERESSRLLQKQGALGHYQSPFHHAGSDQYDSRKNTVEGRIFRNVVLSVNWLPTHVQ
jgi:hypothetical protein